MNRGRKAVACALVLSLLQSVLLAPAVQAGLWQDRREAAKSLPLLAQLPADLAPMGPSNWQMDAPASPLASSLQNFAAPSWLRNLPLQYASLRRLSFPPGWNPSDPIVIHIQDVHQNAEAQENISLTLRELIRGGRLNLVALEGSFETMDFSRFRSYEDADSVRKVTDYLLREGKISGAVHAAFASEKAPPKFAGVDDREHYFAHVDAYKNSRGAAQEVKKALASQMQALETEKAAKLNPDLKAFDAAVRDFRAEKTKLGAYVQFLTARSKKTLPEVQKFLKAFKAESSLDFARAEKERGEIINKLVKNLGRDQVNGLLNASLSYRVGRTRHGDFYVYLRDLCAKNGVEFAKYAAMDAYLQYVLLSDSINAEKLLHEVDSMEAAGYQALAKTPQETILIKKSKWLHLADKLVDYSLSPKEWKEYHSMRDLGDSMLRDLEPFEGFFKEALIRDEAMAANFIRSIGTDRNAAAVLVTGGFHSEGIEERLKRKGIAVLTLAPKISKVETKDGAAYLNVFTQEKTPLEKLFQGEKLFVTPEVFSHSTELSAAAFIALFKRTVESANDAFHRLSGSKGAAYNIISVELTEGIVGTLEGPQGSERFKIQANDESIESVQFIPFSGMRGVMGLFLGKAKAMGLYGEKLWTFVSRINSAPMSVKMVMAAAVALPLSFLFNEMAPGLVMMATVGSSMGPGETGNEARAKVLWHIGFAPVPNAPERTLFLRSEAEAARLMPVPPADTWVEVRYLGERSEFLRMSMYRRDPGETEDQFWGRHMRDSEERKLFDLYLTIDPSFSDTVWLSPGKAYPALRELFGPGGYSSEAWIRDTLLPWLTERGFVEVKVGLQESSDKLFKSLGFTKFGGGTMRKVLNAKLRRRSARSLTRAPAPWTLEERRKDAILRILNGRTESANIVQLYAEFAKDPAFEDATQSEFADLVMRTPAILDHPMLSRSRSGAWHVGDMAQIVAKQLVSSSDRLVSRFTADLAEPLRQVILSALAKSREAGSGGYQTFIDNLTFEDRPISEEEYMDMLYTWSEKSTVEFNSDLQKRVEDSIVRQYQRNGSKVESRRGAQARVSGKGNYSMTVLISQQGYPALTFNILLSNRRRFFADPDNHILAQHRPISFGAYNYLLLLQSRVFDLDDAILDLVIKHEIEEMMVKHRSRNRIGAAEAHRLALQSSGDERSVGKVQAALRAQNQKDVSVRRVQKFLGSAIDESFIRENVDALELVCLDADDYLELLPSDYLEVKKYAANVSPIHLMLDLIFLNWKDPAEPAEFIANLPRIQRLLGKDWFTHNWTNLVTQYSQMGAEQFNGIFERQRNDPWIRNKSRDWLREYFLDIPNIRPMKEEKDIEAVFEGGLENSGSEFDDLRSAIRSYPDILTESIKAIYRVQAVDFRTDDIVKVGVKKIGDGTSNAVFLLTEIVLSNGRVVSQYPIVMKVSKESTYDLTHQGMQQIVQAARELAAQDPPLYPRIGGQWIFDYLHEFWIVSEEFVPGPTLWNEIAGVRMDPDLGDAEKERRIIDLLARQFDVYLRAWKTWNERSGAPHWIESKFIGDPNSLNIIGRMIVDLNSLQESMTPAEIVEQMIPEDVLADSSPLYSIFVRLAQDIMGGDSGRQFLYSSHNLKILSALEEYEESEAENDGGIEPVNSLAYWIADLARLSPSKARAVGLAGLAVEIPALIAAGLVLPFFGMAAFLGVFAGAHILLEKISAGRQNRGPPTLRQTAAQIIAFLPYLLISIAGIFSDSILSQYFLPALTAVFVHAKFDLPLITRRFPKAVFSPAAAAGPAMRLSGQGLTAAQHVVVNEAVAGFFNRPVTASERRMLIPRTQDYRALDPTGALAAEGVRIYALQGLIHNIRTLAEARGVDAPTDLLAHPGRSLRNIYVDAGVLNALLVEPESWRTAWSLHELDHIQNPNDDEEAVQDRSPLPGGITAPRPRTLIPHRNRFHQERLSNGELLERLYSYRDRIGLIDPKNGEWLRKSRIEAVIPLGQLAGLADMGLLVRANWNPARFTLDPRLAGASAGQIQEILDLRELGGVGIDKNRVHEVREQIDAIFRNAATFVPAADRAKMMWVSESGEFSFRTGPLAIQSESDILGLMPLPESDTWIVVLNDQEYPSGLKVWLCERAKGETDQNFRARINSGDYHRSKLFDVSLKIDEQDSSRVILRRSAQPKNLKAIMPEYSTREWIATRLKPWLAGRGFAQVGVAPLPENMDSFRESGFRPDDASSEPGKYWFADLDPAIALPSPGPAMRLSGKSLTRRQHYWVNQAIAEYFRDPQKAEARRLLDPDGEEYKALDPDGELRRNGITIHVFDGLLKRIGELGRHRSVGSPDDLVTHPGRSRRSLYLDASVLPTLLGWSEVQRSAWARHELAHIRRPNASERDIQTSYPLPWSEKILSTQKSAREKLADRIGELVAYRNRNAVNALSMGQILAHIYVNTETIIARGGFKARRADDIWASAMPALSGHLAFTPFTILVDLGLLTMKRTRPATFFPAPLLSRATPGQVQAILDLREFGDFQILASQRDGLRRQIDEILAPSVESRLQEFLPALTEELGEYWVESNRQKLIDTYNALGEERFRELVEIDLRAPWVQNLGISWMRRHFLEIPGMLSTEPRHDFPVRLTGKFPERIYDDSFGRLKSAVLAHPELVIDSIHQIYKNAPFEYGPGDIAGFDLQPLGFGTFNNVFLLTGLKTKDGLDHPNLPVVLKITHSTMFPLPEDGEIIYFDRPYVEKFIEAERQLASLDNPLYPPVGGAWMFRGAYWVITEGLEEGQDLEREKQSILLSARTNTITREEARARLKALSLKRIEVYLSAWKAWKDVKGEPYSTPGFFARDPYYQNVIGSKLIDINDFDEHTTPFKVTRSLHNDLEKGWLTVEEIDRAIVETSLRLMGDKNGREFLLAAQNPAITQALADHDREFPEDSHKAAAQPDSIFYHIGKVLGLGERAARIVGIGGLAVEVPVLLILGMVWSLPVMAGFLAAYTAIHIALEFSTAHRESRAPPTVRQMILQTFVFIPYLGLALQNHFFESGLVSFLSIIAAAGTHLVYDWKSIFNRASPPETGAAPTAPAGAHVLWEDGSRPDAAAPQRSLIFKSEEDVVRLVPLPPSHQVWIMVHYDKRDGSQVRISAYLRQGNESQKQFRERENQHAERFLFDVRLSMNPSEPGTVLLGHGGPAPLLRKLFGEGRYSSAEWFQNALFPWLAERGFDQVMVERFLGEKTLLETGFKPLGSRLMVKSLLPEPEELIPDEMREILGENWIRENGQRLVTLRRDLGPDGFKDVLARAQRFGSPDNRGALWLRYHFFDIPRMLPLSPLRDIEVISADGAPGFTYRNAFENLSLALRSNPELLIGALREIHGDALGELNADEISKVSVKILSQGFFNRVFLLESVTTTDGRVLRDIPVVFKVSRGMFYTMRESHVAFTGEYVARFTDAARRLEQFNPTLYPHIAGTWLFDGAFWIVAESYVPGPTLQDEFNAASAANNTAAVKSIMKRLLSTYLTAWKIWEGEFFPEDPNLDNIKGGMLVDVNYPMDRPATPARVVGALMMSGRKIGFDMTETGRMIVDSAIDVFGEAAGREFLRAANNRQVTQALDELDSRGARIDWQPEKSEVPAPPRSLLLSSDAEARNLVPMPQTGTWIIARHFSDRLFLLTFTRDPNESLEAFYAGLNKLEDRQLFSLGLEVDPKKPGTVWLLPGYMAPQLKQSGHNFVDWYLEQLEPWLIERDFAEIRVKDLQGGSLFQSMGFQYVNKFEMRKDLRAAPASGNWVSAANSLSYWMARFLDRGKSERAWGWGGLLIEIPALVAAGALLSMPAFSALLAAFAGAHFLIERFVARREGAAPPSLRLMLTQAAAFVPYLFLPMVPLDSWSDPQFILAAAAALPHVIFDAIQFRRPAGADQPAAGRNVERAVAERVAKEMDRYSRQPAPEASGMELAREIDRMLSEVPMPLDVENIGGLAVRRNPILEAFGRLNAERLEAELGRALKARPGGRLSRAQAQRAATEMIYSGFVGGTLRESLSQAADIAERMFTGAVIDPSAKDPAADGARILAEHQTSGGGRSGIVFFAGQDQLSGAQKSKIIGAAKKLDLEIEFVESDLFDRGNETVPGLKYEALDAALTQWVGSRERFSSYRLVIPRSLMGDLSGFENLPASALLRRAAIIMIDRALNALPVLSADDLDRVHRAASIIARQA